MNTPDTTDMTTAVQRVSVRALFGINSDMQVDAMTARGAHVQTSTAPTASTRM